LRVVLVEFGDDQEDGGDEQRECEGRDQRISVEVDLSESGRVRDRFINGLWKCLELVSVWQDCVGKVTAVNRRFDEWKRHSGEGDGRL
jgi:hypothetical protein